MSKRFCCKNFGVVLLISWLLSVAVPQVLFAVAAHWKWTITMHAFLFLVLYVQITALPVAYIVLSILPWAHEVGCKSRQG